MVSMLGVFVDMSYTLGSSNILIGASFWVTWSAWQKRHTATQPQMQRQQR